MEQQHDAAQPNQPAQPSEQLSPKQEEIEEKKCLPTFLVAPEYRKKSLSTY